MKSLESRHPFPALPSRAIAISLAGLFAAVAQSHAATTFGDTQGQPTWNRTLTGSPPTALSAVGTDVPFQTILLTVSDDGLYDFRLRSQEPEIYDPFLVLYANTFDPGNPLVDVLLANDDLDGSDAGFDAVSLSQGTIYIAVATGFENNHFGLYQLEVTGPGAVNFVPEPSAALLCLSGSLGFLLRRKRRASISL